MSLFDDIEVPAEEIEPEFIEITYTRERKKKPTYEDQFDKLPIREVFVDTLSDEDKICPEFKERGVTLESNTLANWVINSSKSYLSLSFTRMHACIYDSKIMHIDETPCEVMRIDGTKAAKRAGTPQRIP